MLGMVNAILREAMRAPQRKPTLIMLTSTFLMLTWSYFAAPGFLAARLAAGGDDGRMAGAIGNFAGCFVLLGVLPALLVTLVFRERLTDYGVGIGDARRTWGAAARLLPVFLVVAYVASIDASILTKFPINPRAGESPATFALHAATYLLFYLGWEFHFRGFLLFGMRSSIGDANAVLLQAMASALLHIGSPAAETFGAILAGICWGVIALYSRSLVPGLVQHFLLGLALDVFICFV
jgi:membrane protease YdiL (CAAX protease family)